jgi:hypothetical protein
MFSDTVVRQPVAGQHVEKDPVPKPDKKNDH